jgi:hypothetical protein
MSAPSPYQRQRDHDGHETAQLQPSEGMPPERLQPKNNKRGGQDRTAKHYPKGSEGLIPARRQPRQLRLHEIQLVIIWAKSSRA